MSAVLDVRTGRIPNRLTYGFILAGLAFWLVAPTARGGWEGLRGRELFEIGGEWFWRALAGLLSALIPAVAVVLLGGLGGGDMKLFAACGAWLASPMAVLDMAVVSLATAALMAVFVMVRKRAVRQTLAGVLGVGLMAASRVKPDLPEPTESRPRHTVPFAVAVAVGAGCAAAEHLLGFTLPWSHW